MSILTYLFFENDIRYSIILAQSACARACLDTCYRVCPRLSCPLRTDESNKACDWSICPDQGNSTSLSHSLSLPLAMYDPLFPSPFFPNVPSEDRPMESWQGDNVCVSLTLCVPLNIISCANTGFIFLACIWCSSINTVSFRPHVDALGIVGGWSGLENDTVMACWQDFVAWPALWKAAILRPWVAFCLHLWRRREPFFQYRSSAENRGARAPPLPHQESPPKKRALCSAWMETEKHPSLCSTNNAHCSHSLTSRKRDRW